MFNNDLPWFCTSPKKRPNIGWWWEMDILYTDDWPVWARDEESNYQLKLVAPGINKKFLKIEINDNKFTLKYSPEEKEETKGFFECRPFLYKWDFTSDNIEIKKEDVTAKYLNGILLITIKTLLKEKNLNSFEVDIE